MKSVAFKDLNGEEYPATLVEFASRLDGFLKGKSEEIGVHFNFNEAGEVQSMHLYELAKLKLTPAELEIIEQLDALAGKKKQEADELKNVAYSKADMHVMLEKLPVPGRQVASK